MMEGTRFFLFGAAALVLAVTPGPGMLYVLGRTVNGGRREGILSSLGTFAGGSIHVLAAALGLSAILATSATAFQIVRYVGAAYLIYLGIAMIRNRNLAPQPAMDKGGGSRPFLQGIATEVLNPKTALFFLSFIPQFVSVSRGHVVLQFLVLGTVSVTLNTCADLVVVMSASALARKLKNDERFARRQRTASGVGMIGLGIYVAAK
ncbi:MAG TPA: LysE family translocator [Acidobacteriaceae bacterium]